jgi:predicted acetyltransferase
LTLETTEVIAWDRALRCSLDPDHDMSSTPSSAPPSSAGPSSAAPSSARSASPSSDLETRLTSAPADYEALAPIVGWAYGDDAASSLEWLKRGEPGCLRVAGRRGKIEGGLLEVPMGQWFCGRRLPALGIAGVAIAPEARGQGVALGMMKATLRAARERGQVLSTLYPSTYALYRKAGYELAGSLCRFTLQLRQLPRQHRSHAVESLGAAAAPAVEALYREVARWRPGYLDRGAYIWNRVRTPAREPARCFGVSSSQGLVGYAYARAAVLRRMPVEIALSDFVTRSPLGLRALLSFFADHLTTADRVTWYGGPGDARLLGLPERAVTTSIDEYWMLRIVHVGRALLERGYPELDAAIDLVVEDDVLPENTGTYALRVTAGNAELGAAGAGRRARLSASALAALYTGFVGPRELVSAGQLEADDRSLGALAALFSGPAPACVDYF